MSADLSIIIPVLNEAQYIGSTLEGLADVSGVEIIVVDGGSADGTPGLAAAAGARVIRTGPGRAVQMNGGAAAAAGKILLFLHADTRLAAGFATAVRTALSAPLVAAGAFRLRIDADGLKWRLLEGLVDLRSRLLGLPYGDQGFFLTSRIFQEAGGFAELPIMEDFELVSRLRKYGRITILPQLAFTSARRWQRLGIMKTTAINQLIVTGYLLGVSPTRLARWYGRGDE